MAHPKFGERYTCFSCGKKFYDLKKPEALCPGCGSDQAKAPKKKSAIHVPAPHVQVESPAPKEPTEAPDALLDNRDEEPPYTLDDDGGVAFPDGPEPLTEIDPAGDDAQ